MKKSFFALLLILAAILFFDIDTLVLTEQITSFFSQNEEINPPPSGEITPKTLVLSGKTLNMGDTPDTVMDNFGESADTFYSEYGFLWSVYHDDYKNYIQIGTNSEGKVCAAYTNSSDFTLCGIGVGSSVSEVREAFGEPIKAIKKGNILFYLPTGTEGRHEVDTFLFRKMYIRIFYDCFKNNTVTAIHIIDRDTEELFVRQFPLPTAENAAFMELENFYVTNALRVREGLKPIEHSLAVLPAARSHAAEMAQNNYFSHTDLSGGDVLSRVRAVGVSVSGVAENLASGCQNGIMMHEALMNSEGHRKIILSNYKYLGIGVAFAEDARPYLVQNYFNPPMVTIG